MLMDMLSSLFMSDDEVMKRSLQMLDSTDTGMPIHPWVAFAFIFLLVVGLFFCCFIGAGNSDESEADGMSYCHCQDAQYDQAKSVLTMINHDDALDELNHLSNSTPKVICFCIFTGFVYFGMYWFILPTLIIQMGLASKLVKEINYYMVVPKDFVDRRPSRKPRMTERILANSEKKYVARKTQRMTMKIDNKKNKNESKKTGRESINEDGEMNAPPPQDNEMIVGELVRVEEGQHQMAGRDSYAEGESPVDTEEAPVKKERKSTAATGPDGKEIRNPRKTALGKKLIAMKKKDKSYYHDELGIDLVLPDQSGPEPESVGAFCCCCICFKMFNVKQFEQITRVTYFIHWCFLPGHVVFAMMFSTYIMTNSYVAYMWLFGLVCIWWSWSLMCGWHFTNCALANTICDDYFMWSDSTHTFLVRYGRGARDHGAYPMLADM